MRDSEAPATIPARPDPTVPGPGRRRARARSRAVDLPIGDDGDTLPSDDEREAGHRLSHLGGPAELSAAVLAMLLPVGSKRALTAWRLETAGTPGAEALRETVAALSGAARLPWLERLLGRMALQPIAARQTLVQAARRLMGARGTARPIDRLHWLTLRRGLGETPPLAARAHTTGHGDGPGGETWLESDVAAVAVCTAFLSRLVPHAGDAGTEHGDDPRSDGERWYGAVMTGWPSTATLEIPPCRPPPAEAMVEALQRLQTLSWMQRPQVIRAWLDAAILHAQGGTLARGTARATRLDDDAADALAMVCGLLDTPLPTALARHYVTLPAGTPPR